MVTVAMTIGAACLTAAVAVPVAVEPIAAGIASPGALAPAGRQEASNYLAGCAQSGSTLSALFVLDQSGSLSATDPQGIRYDALRIALEQLAKMRPASEKELAVEAAVAAFDHQYSKARSVARWTRLDLGAFDGDTVRQADAIDQMMRTTEERTFPQGGTDFEAALEGAASDMEDRGGRGTCRVVFWFTDGSFESATDSVPAARERMCRPDGLLDQIRRAGIVVVGIQLADNSADLLPMSEGEGDGVTCGTAPIPSDWAPGMYIRADDPAALKRIFGSVVDIVQGCSPADAESKLIDPGVRRFRATVETPSKVRAARLDAPDGTVINAPASGTTEADGYQVSVQSDENYAAYEVTLPEGKGAGAWSLTTDPVTTAKDMSLCVFHDLHLEMADPDQPIPAGISAQIRVKAVDSAGGEADLGVFASAAVGSAAVGPDGNIRQSSAVIANGGIDVTLDSDMTDARIELSVTVDPVTESGIALAPITARLPLVLTLPKEFPSISPVDELELGTAVKVDPTSAKLELTGSTEGPTKICFGPFASVTVPEEAAGTVPEISETCVDLKTGESKQVKVTVHPVAPAEGAGSAELPVTLYSADTELRPTQEASFAIPVVWRFGDPLNAPVMLAVIVVVALISILLPLVAMGLANVVSAKFDTKGLQAGQIAVLVGDGVMRRPGAPADGTDRVIDVYRDRDSGVQPRNARRFNLFGVDFRAKGTLNPFGAPRFTATAPAGSRIMSSVGFPIPGDRAAAVSPGLGFVTLIVVSDAALAGTAREVQATLIFLLRDTAAFTDGTLADRLTNKAMTWERIDEWRPDPADRTDLADPGSGPGAGSGRRPESGLDADFGIGNGPGSGGPGGYSRPSNDDPYFN
jgi:hypothetical protein